ncbi:hypothetical protein ACOI1H_16485 [Loktanella sp. DJP18]|uniref:hypothetical protein n=1 Tax=Loktanella sp. DJP18 TaxID=3409788 RepID=UPI003BB6B161
MPLRATCLVLAVLATPVAAQSDRPLSAIDWLSQSVEPPPAPAAATTPAPARPNPNEPPVAEGTGTPPITVTPLDAAAPKAVGTLGQDVTGLPPTLWVNSDVDTLTTLIQAEGEPALPALRDLFRTLLLTEALPPPGDDRTLLLARIDKLLDLADLPQAMDLIRAADPTEPALFRRWFDVALLTGTEDQPCAAMLTAPGLAPTYPARIFCTARGGDWMAAALTLNTHRALGDVSEAEDALLSRFLDADLVDPAAPLPPPERLSPLIFRMREAIGEGLSTGRLPLAFAHADLRDTVGEKARLDAAERLALHGALSAQDLARVMTGVTPAASGGVWDRLDAFQKFNAAINAGDADAIAETLPPVWSAMQAIRAEVPFADLYAGPISRFDLTGAASQIATTVTLLSDDYVAAAQQPGVPPLLRAIATEDFADVKPDTAIEEAVVAGFSNSAPPQVFVDLMVADKLGEALLRVLPFLDAGVAGDARSVTDALLVLRRAGLTDTARRAALQMLLLDRTR